MERLALLALLTIASGCATPQWEIRDVSMKYDSMGHPATKSNIQYSVLLNNRTGESWLFWHDQKYIWQKMPREH